MRNIEAKIRLFKKITDTHCATDYSSIDYLYPPLFAWDKTQPGDKIQNGSIFEHLLDGHYNLYAHFPFCRYKCTFCRQFSSAVPQEKHYQQYTDLLIREIKLYKPYFDKSKFTGIYFGGGTPTLFNLEKILEEIYKNFNFCSPFYLNIESTPDSLNRKKLLALKNLGLTRLLIGVQSLDPRVLKAIRRPVYQQQVFRKNYENARSIGIPFINIELVCGLPEQSFESFVKDLNYVIGLKPDSIHIYPYTQTPLTILGRGGLPLEPIVANLIEKMYGIGQNILNTAGYIYRGDDFCLRDAARSPYFKTKAGLSLGLSSIGCYPLYGRHYILRTFNTLNLAAYSKTILHNLLPIEKFYCLDSKDEILRMELIKLYRYGKISDVTLKKKAAPLVRFNIKKLYSYFKKEFLFLQKTGKIKIDDSFSRIDFSGSDWLIYSKIFYSPKVLKRCKRLLKT